MSWETLVTGEFVFKRKPSKKDIELIKEHLEIYPECKTEWGMDKIEIEKRKEGYIVAFLGLNWTSHLSKDEIEALIKKLKPKLSRYAISLYYLNEPHEDFYWEEGEDNADE